MQTQPHPLDVVAWEADPDTLRFRKVSASAERLLGFPAEEWLEPGFWVERLHPEDRERAIAECIGATEAGEDHRLAYRLVAADGAAVWVEDDVEIVRDGDEIVALRGVIVDRTPFRREADLAEFLLQRSADLITILDADGRVRYDNPAVEHILGYAHSALVGDDALDHVHPDDRAKAMETLETARTTVGHTRPVEVRLRHRDGSYRYVETIASALGRGEVLLSSRDITAQRREIEANKMEALGRLAGSIAHDFNNVLFIVRWFGDLLVSELEGEPAAWAGELVEAAERGTTLTRQLVSFSREKPAEREQCDVADVLRRFDPMVRSMLAKDCIELRSTSAPALPQAAIGCGNLEQVLLNLVLNARNAIVGGGHIEISVERADDRVRVAVSDTGPGMDEETRARVFEPYFTTKRDGTGLGLANVFALVSQRGGTIDVDSTVGVGTTFEILLPAVSDGPPRILVVEDDAAVRDVVTQCLADAGYVVVGAADAASARAVEGPFDVVVADVRLPDGLGTDLVLTLLNAQPELHVVFMAGFGGGTPAEAELADAVLEKPFSLDDLRSVVAEAVASDR